MLKPNLIIFAMAAFISAVIGGAAGYFAGQSTTPSVDTSQKGDNTSLSDDAFTKSLRASLYEHPEIVESALYALQEKRSVAAAQNRKQAIANARVGLLGDPRAPYVGAKDAAFVVVEFFDYNCGFCKIASEWVREAVQKHPGKIKVIMKDFPILEGRSKGSKESSAAAWAAQRQGQEKFEAFHFALMKAQGGYDTETINKIARESGVDVALMRADMQANAQAFEALMEANYTLARQLGIDGTPAFVIDDTLISGADTDSLQQALEATL